MTSETQYPTLPVQDVLAPVPDVPAAAPAMSPEAAQLLLNFRAVDPTRQGVGLERIRPFYPKARWSDVTNPARELVQAGLLKKRGVMNAKGKIGFELYTWVEV